MSFKIKSAAPSLISSTAFSSPKVPEIMIKGTSGHISFDNSSAANQSNPDKLKSERITSYL